MLQKTRLRKLSTGEESLILKSSEKLFQWALKALGRRAFPTKEIERELLARAENPAEVEEVLQRLSVCGYLDDRTFVESFVAKQLRRGFYSRSKLSKELMARDLDSQLVNEVLEKHLPQEADQYHLSCSLNRKIRTWSGPMDEKRIARLYNYLLGQGFNQEAIRQEFKRRFNRCLDWED